MRPVADRDHVVAGIVARLLELPHVRASWTLRGARYSPHDNPADAESTQAR